MPRRKRSGFGDLLIERAAFDRGDARCPSCRRPIGPGDHPTEVRTLDGTGSKMATMRCGRCSAELTLRFSDSGATAETG